MSDKAHSADAGASTSTTPVNSSERLLFTVSLVVLQVIAAIEIVFAGMAAIMSLMVFGAPGSTERLDLVAFLIVMLLVPPVAIGMCLYAWTLHGEGNSGKALRVLATVVAAGIVPLFLLAGLDALVGG